MLPDNNISAAKEMLQIQMYVISGLTYSDVPQTQSPYLVI